MVSSPAIASGVKRKIEPTTSADATKKVALNAMNQALKKMNEEPNDEFKIFGDFIATELRKIPKEQANKVQRKMQRVLLDFMDELDNNAISNVILWLNDCERSRK